MKKILFSSLLLLSFALPGKAQEVPPETCSQHNTIYDAVTGFCIYPDRPDVFTTTSQNILVDIRQDPASSSYMVQAFDLTTETLVLAVVLDNVRQPERFLIGDLTIAEQYQEPIDAGLKLLENWQP